MRLCIALPATLLLLVTALIQPSFAQSSDCTGKETQAQLSSIDPVYVDAMELARNLIDHGFIVKCVLGSKEQNRFKGQKGAAFYRTDRGSFDVLFLPKGEPFDAAKIVEQRRGRWYLYSFQGSPKSPTHSESLRREYFIESGSLLFEIWGDADLASIQSAIGGSPLTTDTESPNGSDSCPVTTTQSKSFVPPSPYPVQLPASSFWFGTEKLWTILPADGIWKSLPHYRPTDSAFRNKLFWWHEGYDWRTENPPSLVVTGRRLDAPTPPLTIDEHANSGWTDDTHHPFMVVGIFIPTLGCWQITGDYKGNRLTFVVLVTE